MQEQEYPHPDFKIFVSSVSLQATICLGLVESPVTGKKERNMKQAQFLIDTLDMIREKTKGNLLKDEEEFLEDAIANLKLNYSKIIQEEGRDDK